MQKDALMSYRGPDCSNAYRPLWSWRPDISSRSLWAGTCISFLGFIYLHSTMIIRFFSTALFYATFSPSGPTGPTDPLSPAGPCAKHWNQFRNRLEVELYCKTLEIRVALTAIPGGPLVPFSPFDMDVKDKSKKQVSMGEETKSRVCCEYVFIVSPCLKIPLRIKGFEGELVPDGCFIYNPVSSLFDLRGRKTLNSDITGEHVFH